MGRWVTSKGRRIYIPDEGEKVPEKYQKNVVEGTSATKSAKASATTDNVTGANSHTQLVDKLKSNGLKLDSADAHSMEHSSYFNDEKVTMYDKDGNEYQGTYNKYSDGGREIVNIKKTKEGKKETLKKQIDKDNDTKEKQIAENKKQVDDLNGKWHSETKEERAEYERRRDAARSLDLPQDTMGQLATHNFSEAGVKKAVDRGWITQAQADKINGKKSTGVKKGRADKGTYEQAVHDMYSKYSEKFSKDPNRWLMYGEEGKKAYREYKEAVNKLEPNKKKRDKYYRPQYND